MVAMSETVVGTPYITPTGTRSAILEETIRVIDEQGDGAVRVRDVVAAVGVATTSLYHFFGSRENLLDEANAERYKRTLYGPNYEQFEAAVAGCETREQLKRALITGMSMAQNSIGVGHRRVRVMVLGSAQSRPNLAAHIDRVNAEYVERTGGLFGAAAERGWTREGLDPRTAALWYLAQTTGRILLDSPGSPADSAAWDRTEAAAMISAVFGDSY